MVTEMFEAIPAMRGHGESPARAVVTLVMTVVARDLGRVVPGALVRGAGMLLTSEVSARF
jgi:hypothetical protein